MGVSESRGFLLGVLILRGSYYLGINIGVPFFRTPPNHSDLTSGLRDWGLGFRV